MARGRIDVRSLGGSRVHCDIAQYGETAQGIAAGLFLFTGAAMGRLKTVALRATG